MNFILASNNTHKCAEIAALLPECRLITLREAGLDLDIEEDGASFAENARIKALAVWRAAGRPAVADDSGLEVAALGGAPGIYSARYAGPGKTDAQRTQKLLAELAALPDAPRDARFVCAMACVLADGTVITVEGDCPGRIALSPAGANGFGYDPVFDIPWLGRTMAQLTPAEKNAMSHRAAACRLLRAELRRHAGKEGF